MDTQDVAAIPTMTSDIPTESLSFTAIHGENPKDAGLTFAEAFAYEAKEYRKTVDALFKTGDGIASSVIEGLALELGRKFDRICHLYDQRP